MEQQARLLRAETIVRGLCIVFAGCGIYILTAEAIKLPKEVRPPPTASDLCIRLIFHSLALLIGAGLLRAAWLGWQHRTARSVRGLCLASLAIAFACGLPVVAKLHPISIGQPPLEIPWNGLWEIAVALLATVVYFVLCRSLVSQLDLKDERSASQQRRSVEQWLGLVTFLLWTHGVNLAMDLIPKASGQKYIPKQPWELLALLGPALLAVIIYKVGVRLLSPRQA